MNGTMRAVGGMVVAAVLCGTFLLTALTTGGCEKKEEPSKTAPKPPSPDVTPKAVAANNNASGSATTSPATTRGSASDAGIAAASGRSASAAREREAQTLLARATQAIKDNQLDEARASLDKVEPMKDSLAPATRKNYQTARDTLAHVEKLQTAELPAETDGENK